MRYQKVTYKNSQVFSSPILSSDEEQDESGAAVVSKVQTVPKEPKMYRVLLHNDDYTPMDFVVFVLEHFFNKSRSTAEKIMMDVHKKGVGVCGVYPHEIAETKTKAVQDAAKENEYPLLCTCQED